MAAGSDGSGEAVLGSEMSTGVKPVVLASTPAPAAAIPLATQWANASIVCVGLYPPDVGRSDPSATKRLGTSQNRPARLTTEVAGELPIRIVPCWWTLNRGPTEKLVTGVGVGATNPVAPIAFSMASPIPTSWLATNAPTAMSLGWLA